MGKKLLYGGFLFTIFLLFLYSFTQVDLSLTLSRASIFLTAEKFFQQIGYFNRPLSTGIYIIILLLLFVFYFGFLWLARMGKLSKKGVWKLLLITTGVLVFSYNAFSYDVFNYIFDARIITHYHQNPYIHRALDYAHDPMLSFMHWIERTYPYGPVWLIVTVPLSFIGLQLFLPTFFLFKLLAAASYIGTAFYIGKIAAREDAKNEIFSVLAFALNPLVIIESLVSAHNDVVMLFFAIFAFWLLTNKKNIRAIIMIILSIGVKFATVFALPVFIFVFFSNIFKKKASFTKYSLITIIFMIAPVVLATVRTNFQPWYLLFVIPFASLLAKKFYVLIPIICMSFFALLEYVPFLYKGDWNTPVPEILFWLTSLGVASSLIFTFIFFLQKNMIRRN